MNAFENYVYSIIDDWIFTEFGLPIFILGGYVLCGIFCLLLLLPWCKQVPQRFFVAAGAALPVIVLVYGSMFNLLVRGRKLEIMLALSPIILAFVPSAYSLILAIMGKTEGKRFLVIFVLISLIIAQLWAFLVLWLATNSGFMGASC